MSTKKRQEDAAEFLDRYAEFELDAKAEGDAAGVIKGYASIWGETDGGNDQVIKGAFSKSLKGRSERRIPMLLGHNQSAVPIGVWTAIREDAKGLYVEGKLALGSDAGRQMYEVLRAGAEMGISIGYRTIRKEIVVPGKGAGDASEWAPGAIRKLLEIDLREISLVPIPMLDSARVTQVKSEEGEAGAAEIKALIRTIESATQNLELLNTINAARAALST